MLVVCSIGFGTFPYAQLAIGYSGTEPALDTAPEQEGEKGATGGSGGAARVWFPLERGEVVGWIGRDVVEWG